MGFIQEILKLNRQISDLLGTCDSFMSEKHWKTVGTSRIMDEMSTSLFNPEKWYPNVLVKFYKSNKHPHLLLFISIMLFDRDKEYNNFTEPLIAAGWFDYGITNNFEGLWDYWHGRCHGFMDAPKHDGTLHTFTFSSECKKWKKGRGTAFRSASSFAWPLVTITNAEELKNKIIDHLLDNIPTNNMPKQA